MRPVSLAVLVCGLILGTALTACRDTPPPPVSARMPGQPGAGLDVRLRDAARLAELSTALALPLRDTEPQELPLQDGPSTVQVRDRLGAGENRLPGGHAYTLWTVRLDQEGYLRAALSGTDADLLAAVYGGRPGRLLPLVAYDLRGGAGGTPLVEAVVPAGEYTVALSGPEDAGYTLEVTAGTIPPGTLGGDTALTATLDSLAGTGAAGRTGAATYPVLGRGGQEITVTATSGELDPALFLLRGVSRALGVRVAADPGGAGDGGARIRATLPETGRYTLVVSPARSGQTGQVRLQTRSATPVNQVFDNAGSGRGRYALLVGIDDYPGQGNDIDGAAVDVRMIRDVLVDRFEFRPEDVVLLADEQATRENLANGIIQHLGQAGGEGLALFYFSGLGTSLPEDLGITAPLDPRGRPGADGGDRALVVRHAREGATLVLDEELGYLLAGLRAGRTLAILDASFAPVVERGAPAGSVSRNKAVSLSQLEAAGPLALPTRLLPVAPGITHALTGLETDSAALTRFASTLYEPGPALVWWAGGPRGTVWSAPAGAGASVFTRSLADALVAALPEATLADVHARVVRDVGAYVRGTGLTSAGPELAGSASDQALDAFFRSR